jgi:hypothetical protein
MVELGSVVLFAVSGCKSLAPSRLFLHIPVDSLVHSLYIFDLFNKILSFSQGKKSIDCKRNSIKALMKARMC